MAEGKERFILHRDIIHTVRKMPKDKAGELFETILAYVNDENPEPQDMVVSIAFEPIKRQLKRDLVKYKESKEKLSKAGKASAEARRLKEGNDNEQCSTTMNDVQQQPTKSTVNVSVNVNDNLKVIAAFNSVTGKEITLTKQRERMFAARFKEGYTVADFETVIRVKHAEWCNDPKMKKYITPETLFNGENFQKYLEQDQEVKQTIKREGALSNGLVV